MDINDTETCNIVNNSY